MKVFPSRRGWLSRGLCAVAALPCFGGVAFCVWMLHQQGGYPYLFDPRVEPEAIRSILDHPGSFVAVIDLERQTTGHACTAAGSFMAGVARLVLVQLVVLVLIWLSLPRSWWLPGSVLPRRLEAWRAGRASPTHLGTAAALTTPGALAWSGRQVAGAAIVLAGMTLLVAELGSDIARRAAAALLQPTAATAPTASPDAERVLAAIVEVNTRWRWTLVALQLSAALLLGLQVLATALLLLSDGRRGWSRRVGRDLRDRRAVHGKAQR
jgi:hypothetical protein